MEPISTVFLKNRSRSARCRWSAPVRLQVWLVGFDIVGDFIFPAPKEGGTIELSFEKCRFRDGLGLPAVKEVPSFSISDSIIRNDLKVAGTGIDGELQIMNVQARSAAIRLTCASLYVSGLACGGDVKLTNCETGKCELLGLDAKSLDVDGGTFGLLSVTVTRLGEAKLHSFGCKYFRIKGRGEGASVTLEGFPLLIKGCEVGDEFVIAGLNGAKVEIERAAAKSSRCPFPPQAIRIADDGVPVAGCPRAGEQRSREVRRPRLAV
jgi:hypothetical protein